MRLLSALAAALLAAACSSQPPAPEQDPAGVESRTPRSAETRPVQSDGFDPASVAALKDPRSILSKRSIYFDYDSYIVKDEFRSLIEAHAKFLVANTKARMLVQGNADDRGSREYNLALGQKRADAVKKALQLLGAREDQIESVSLGEEKPVCSDQGEECWGKNRRGDMMNSAANEF